MAKRGREQDPPSRADLDKYVEELEWATLHRVGGTQCAMTGCRRVVSKESECNFCEREPNMCIICDPHAFARCEPYEDCGNFFCQLHGDIGAKTCEECGENPED